MLVLKMNRFILLSKRHSLTTYIVKFVTDSFSKNNKRNIFSVGSMYIKKSIDIGQPIFHKVR